MKFHKTADIENTINLKKLLFLFCLCVSFFSCKKSFLEVSPIDRIATDAFFKTAEDIQGAVNGIYSLNRQLYSQLFAYDALHESRSDNTTLTTGQAEQIASDKFIADAGSYFYFTWNFSYTCINLCNAVIERAPAVQMDEALKNRLIGEAKFIRGMVYFNLAEDFGGVPLRLTETKNLSGDNNLARSSVAEVYQQVFSDLQFAVSNLPASYSGADVGRATSGAALGMLGKAQLQMGDKNAAATSFRGVIASNKYNLLPNYSDLWDPANRNTSESIFEIQFLPPNQGSPYWNLFSTSALNVPGGSGNSWTPTKDLISSYEQGDVRLNSSIATDPTGKPYIVKFRDTTITTGNTARNDFPVMRYADILLSLAEAVGESPEAYDLINSVRSRAHLSPIGASTPGTFSMKLLHERQDEFAFEGQRWHDLQRLPPDEAIAIMNTHLAKEFPGQNIIIDSHDLIAPIPLGEIQNNLDAVQNPGY